MVDYLCVLLMGDSAKRQPRHIIQQYSGLDRNIEESKGH
jgi:hypothetical protein